MTRLPKFWGIHAAPSPPMKVILGLVPLVLLLAGYLFFSHTRLAENPSDKIAPSPSQMADAVKTIAFTLDRRTGTYLMWADTVSSLRRIFTGLGLAAVTGLILGLNMGVLPGVRSLMFPVVTVLSIVPPLAILPILFILFGVGEVGKVTLIFLGSMFLITRDVHYSVDQIPKEQFTKSLTLGASQFQIVYRIVLPQVMPRLLTAVRLCLGPAWLFLIASEAIASTDGLGYRIFLVRRYLAMDVIIPYVLWITFLGFLMDGGIRLFVSRKYPWYGKE
ncbi:MAG: ABC transporter permease [Pseudomonadota bacterium]